jgi:uncharacterized lipoprotein YbaY
MIRHFALLGLTTAILLGGCAEKRSSFGLLYGDVTYDRRAALPPDAELEVGLYDLSRGDAEGTLVGQSRAKASGTDGPAHFAVRYNPRTIDPAHTYVVRAIVAAEDGAILETREAYPVLTKGHPQRAELVLEPTATAVVRPDGPIDLIPAYRERGTD